MPNRTTNGPDTARRHKTQLAGSCSLCSSCLLAQNSSFFLYYSGLWGFWSHLYLPVFFLGFFFHSGKQGLGQELSIALPLMSWSTCVILWLCTKKHSFNIKMPDIPSWSRKLTWTRKQGQDRPIPYNSEMLLKCLVLPPIPQTRNLPQTQTLTHNKLI